MTTKKTKEVLAAPSYNFEALRALLEVCRQTQLPTSSWAWGVLVTEMHDFSELHDKLRVYSSLKAA